MNQMKNVAVITGASGGIGKELAIIHASKGSDLVLIARREKELVSLRKELEEKFNINAEIIVADLMQTNSAEDIFRFLKDNRIEVDCLINNAGLGGYGRFHERELEKEKNMIRLNIIALTELTHLLLPQMIEKGKGRILNTASSAGFLPGPLQSVYYATKAYVVSFSQGISRELKGTGVTVSALCPGPVKTGFELEAGMAGSGLFDKAASAISVAKAGYKGMEKGKLIIITDVRLRFMLNWILPFVPRRVVLRLVEKLQTVK